MQSSVPPLKIGPIEVWPPVVLAPMAGVTDAPFRVLCSEFGPALYVNQMVTARGLVERHPTSWQLTRFHPSEQVRSLQLYGTEPRSLSEAVRLLVGDGLVDHVDMNFGCPAAKVTRNGGGAALPVKRKLLADIVRTVVAAADRSSGGTVPVTVKFRLGIDDDHLTYLDTGRIAEAEGAAAVALHARTALQHYAPPAHWDAIGELKAAVTSIPVLGNGDIFTPRDALAMMAETGCDGVVIGRGCLGRPWLFAELDAAFSGALEPTPPTWGQVDPVIRRHVELIVEWHERHPDGEEFRLSPFRKHLAWYLKGYPVGAEARQAAGQVATAGDIDRLLDGLDPDAHPVVGAERFVRSHSHALQRVALPDRWLDDPDQDDVALGPGAEALVSGG